MSLSTTPIKPNLQHNRSAKFKSSFLSTSFQVKSPPANRTNVLIKKHIKQLSAKKLFGYPHVKSYLFDQYRRGCRPNTIRSRFQAIMLFITYLKSRGRTYLEQVTRDDLCSFIELEQDRGMKPATVLSRLRALYGFLGYLIERDIVHPDVIRK